MGWVERNIEDHLIPNPCHAQGHLSLKIAPRPVQPILEHFQEDVLTVPLGKSTPAMLKNSEYQTKEHALLLPEKCLYLTFCLYLTHKYNNVGHALIATTGISRIPRNIPSLSTVFLTTLSTGLSCINLP